MLVIRLSRLYSKSKEEIIEILISFIEESELDYFNSRTFVNKKLTEEFRDKLENADNLSRTNRIIEENIQSKKEQILRESNKGERLRSELSEVSQKLKKLKEENSALKKETQEISRKIKIIEYKNHNKKIERLQGQSMDYKKHQRFLIVVTIVGIFAAVFLFFLKIKTK